MSQTHVAVISFVSKAKFQSAEETLQVNNSYSSPSGSYLQIAPVSSAVAQVILDPCFIQSYYDMKSQLFRQSQLLDHVRF